MKRSVDLMFVLLGCAFQVSFSQNFSVGHKQITFVDPSRGNRNILTEIYYPANSAGDNVPIANGSFPLLIYGHGFLMAWDAYKCYWDTLVPEGYIMAFPRTEGSIAPNHEEFGKDLRFLNEQFKVENNTSTSFFYQKIANASAIMGHSMGGGASFLAAKNYTNFTTLINFAAANTNPSAISAAAQVTVPLLMFSGGNDGVTPPSSHQIPMYDSCISTCKTHVTILGGGHCYFADYNFNCSFGEATTSPQPTITREEQQERVFHLLKPYLNYVLKGSIADSITFFNRLQNNAPITYQRQCNTPTEVVNIQRQLNFRVYPSPASDNLIIEVNHMLEPAALNIYDITGHRVYQQEITPGVYHIDASSWAKGLYVVSLCGNTQKILIE